MAKRVATSVVRPRPPFLRALGRREPPEQVLVDGQPYGLERVFKHDSWAATALYSPQLPGLLPVVCKFNRQASVFGLPLAWVGPILARREAAFLARLAPSGGVPMPRGPLRDTQGRFLRHAVAHDFVEGEPLSRRSVLNDGFFPALQRLLAAMHAQGVAYVDLHKMENVLLGLDGQPWLIDFQVSFALPARQPWRSVLGPCFGLLRSGDTYHLMKHWIRLKPEQCGLGPEDLDRFRPRWIRWHRRIGVPLRSLRRNLLVRLGVRAPGGHVQSERFVEEGIRQRNIDPGQQ